MSDRITEIVVCVNLRFGIDVPSCAARGGEEIAAILERELDARRLAVDVVRVRCLGLCAKGPVLRLAPGGAFHYGVRPGDVPGIVEGVAAQADRQAEETTADPLPGLPGC